MSDTPPRNHSAGINVLLGVFRVARGRANGIALFGASPQAFLASLAPLVAFPLVGAILMLWRGGGIRSVADLLATLCAVLTPPVISWQFAHLWHREEAWSRFATAFNWCQWVLPAVAMLLLTALGLAMTMGLPDRSARVGLILGLVLYGLWLHWFLARHALSLSGNQAALLVFGVNFGTVMMVLGPRLLVGMGRE